MQAYNGVHEAGGKLACAITLAAGRKVLQLAQALDVHLDGIVPAPRLRQAGHGILRPFLARALWQWQRYERARRGLLARLVALAQLARLHVQLYISGHPGPGEVALERRKRLV